MTWQWQWNGKTQDKEPLSSLYFRGPGIGESCGHFSDNSFVCGVGGERKDGECELQTAKQFEKAPIQFQQIQHFLLDNSTYFALLLLIACRSQIGRAHV